MNTRDHDITDDQLTPDPRLEALLDQALAPASVPGGLPPGLDRRIMARIVPLLARRRRGVLALLGPQVRVLALAACVVIVVGVTIWAFSRHAVRTSPNAHTPLPSAAEIDEELATLSVRVDEASQPDDWSSIGSQTDQSVNDLRQDIDAQDDSAF